jgi:uncharacterized membrane protein
MGISIRPSRAIFAAAIIGLGICTLIYGNAASIWMPIPKTLPGRPVVVYICAFTMLGTGIGLLLRAFVIFACRVLLPFVLLWLALLKLPGLLRHPLVMVPWETFGETAAVSAGVWCLFAAHAGAWEQRHLKFAVGQRGIRVARLLFIAALPMFGLAHFAYLDFTASLVPKWMHYPLGWTYLTGAGSLAAAAGMLFAIYPRLAVNLEAAMLWIFTLLVWVPTVVSAPNNQDDWSELLTSWSIAAGAWLVADTYRSVPWLRSGRAARAVTLD